MKNVNSEMENKPFSINELKDAMFSLKINKSTGHDDISYNVVVWRAMYPAKTYC